MTNDNNDNTRGSLRRPGGYRGSVHLVQPEDGTPTPESQGDAVTAPPSAPAAPTDSTALTADDQAFLVAEVRRLREERDAAQAKAKTAEAETEVFKAAAAHAVGAVKVADAPAAPYTDSDLVTVLHGYGKVEPTRVEYKQGASKALYQGTGGVVRKVVYSDAVHWQKLWGTKNVHILPADAGESDFAKAAGVQPPAHSKLIVMLDATNLDGLVEAWGMDNATKFTERLATALKNYAARGGR